MRNLTKPKRLFTIIFIFCVCLWRSAGQGRISWAQQPSSSKCTSQRNFGSVSAKSEPRSNTAGTSQDGPVP